MKDFFLYPLEFDDQGVRLETLIKRQWPTCPYGSLHKAFRKKWILLDEKPCSPQDRIFSENQRFLIQNRWIQTMATLPCQDSPTPNLYWLKKLESWILQETPDFLLLNKPAGIACQGGSGQKIHIDGLLQQKLMHSSSKNRVLQLVHRLDKDTSGLLLISKNRAFSRFVGELFQTQKIRKRYIALVKGHPEKKFLTLQPLVRKGPVMAIADPDRTWDSTWKIYSAETRYQVIEYAEAPPSWGIQKVALLACFPKTGRMHQIRCHCQSLGYPILGDSLYGDMKSQKTLPSLALHCESMSFVWQGTLRTFHAPLSQSFQNHLKILKISDIS